MKCDPNCVLPSEPSVVLNKNADDTGMVLIEKGVMALKTFLAEFLSKISIVLEEVDESKFWMVFLNRIGIFKEIDTTAIQKEIDELVRIFSAIRKKMKEKVERG